jgi:hypothetical protein
MASCQASARVQRAGFSALRDLATSDESRPTVVAHGGVEAVVQAMLRHTRAEDIQEQGCLALGNIAFRCIPPLQIFSTHRLQGYLAHMKQPPP